jgi:hypothetical protein
VCFKGINVIVIAPDDRDAERGLAKEWVAAEVRCRRAVDAVLLSVQVCV